MTSEKRGLVLTIAFALLALGAVPSGGSECVKARGAEYDFPFFALPELFQTDTVTVYVTEAFRSSSLVKQASVEAGLKAWNDCKAKGVPTFRLNWTTERPPAPHESEQWARSLLLDMDPRNVTRNPDTGLYNAGEWSSAENVITLFERCPTDATHGLPCRRGQPGTAIEWDLPGYLTNVITHEVGHAVGLDHDHENSSCETSIMSAVQGPEIATKSLTPFHCVLGGLVNNAEADCTDIRPVPGEPHPCNSVVTDPRGEPGGPDEIGEGGAAIFCQEYPWVCSGPDAGPWGRSGIACNWECVTWASDTGDTGGGCSWHCSGTPIAADEGQTGGASGVGPHLKLTSPARNATLSGTVNLSGWAMDFSGVESVTFGIDGELVQVSSYRYGLSNADACRLPDGFPHSACNPNSGFSAQLDTRSIANGLHTLEVVAYDIHGWTSSIEVPIVVDNCGDEVRPTISVASHTDGEWVTGTESVTPNASDDVGVVRVKFYIDGVVRRNDSKLPFLFDWDTTTETPGPHTLQLRAYDACWNNRWSEPITLYVAEQPGIEVAEDYAGTVVPNGSVVGFGATPPDEPLSLRFLITNPGNAPLVLTNPASLVSGGCFSQIETPASSVPAGGEAHFRVRFQCAAPGTYTGAVQIATAANSTQTFGLAGTVTDVPRPDVALYLDYDGSPLASGDTDSLGAADPGATTSTRYRITNTGDALLRILDLQVSGSCFSLVESPAASVPAGGSTTFRVRFQCAYPGSYTGSLSLWTDDPDENPIALNLTGVVRAATRPEIAIRHTEDPLFPLLVGGSSDVGTTEVGAAVSRRYTLSNLGDGTLTLANPSSFVSGACFSLIEVPAAPVAPGAETFFRVRFLCAEPGTYSGAVSLLNDDPDENPFHFTLTGTATVPEPPEIDVFESYDGTPVPSGGSSTIGTTTAGSPTSRRFTVRNNGSGPLEIANPASLVTGACFSLIEEPAASVPAGSETYFRVRLHCNSVGTYTGTVSIGNDDPDEAPYVFAVTGTVTP